MASSESWQKIFEDYNIHAHDFNRKPFVLTADQIKESVQDFRSTTKKEVRILCKQDSRSDRPDVFIDNNLFLLPIKNGTYAILQGDGYMDIPPITSEPIAYSSKLDFHLDTSEIGDSEMQHLDKAYASSIIRTFMDDPSLVLTIRGRKYTPKFGFNVGSQEVKVESVQTEVDAGYEGKDKIVLIEAKSDKTTNTIIRQMYYPFRQWREHTRKKVYTLFFEMDHKSKTYNIWQFEFTDPNDYLSIKLAKSAKYLMK